MYACLVSLRERISLYRQVTIFLSVQVQGEINYSMPIFSQIMLFCLSGYFVCVAHECSGYYLRVSWPKWVHKQT